jgi:hypothetical protein
MVLFEVSKDLKISFDEKTKTCIVIDKIELSERIEEINKRLKEITLADDKALLAWAKSFYPTKEIAEERIRLENELNKLTAKSMM